MHHDKNFSLIDYLVFGSLLVASSLIGVFFAWKARHAKNAEHYFTGGRKLAVFPVTMSLIASFMSTNTLLGVPAEVYQVGTQFGMQVISITIVILLAAEVFMPVFYRIGCTSVNEYLYQRFKSKKIKTAGSIGFIIATIPYVSVVLYGPAVALSSVTPISISTSIMVVGVICTFYTSIGGIKAVIWTDVLQCILMVLGVGIVIVQGLIEVGGYRRAMEILEEGGRLKLFNMKFDLYNHDNFWNVVSGATISWGACYCVSQTQVQRYLSMKSQKEAKKTLYLNLPGLLLISMMAIFSGVVIYGKYRNCDPLTLGIIERHDQLVPYFVMDTLSGYPGLAGFFVACVFSGSLSTLSSGFNALAAITWEDLLKERMKKLSPEGSMRAVKLIAFSYGLLAIAVSFGVGSLGTVMQASMSLFGSMNGPLFGLFTIAVLCRFVNAKGALTGFLVGLAVSLTISLGAIALPRPHVSLPTTVGNCSVETVQYYLGQVEKSQQSGSFLEATDFARLTVLSSQRYIPYYENPSGLSRIFHLSYLIMSVVGFLITITVGVLVSLLTGGIEENEGLDELLLSPYSRYFSLDFLAGKTTSKGDGGGNNNNNNNNNNGKGALAKVEVLSMTVLKSNGKSNGNSG